MLTTFNSRERGDIQEDMRTGLYPMVADVLHTGHVAAIEEAKSKCGWLIVALNCRPDGKEPIQTVYERYMQLRAVRWVDSIVPYEGQDDLRSLITSLDFDIYFLGEDYCVRAWDHRDLLEVLGKEVVYLSRKHNFSSSELRRRLYEKGIVK